MHTLHVWIQISPILLLLLAFFLRRDDRRRIDDLVTLALILAYGRVGSVLLKFLTQPYVPTYDAAFLKMDRAVGIDPLAAFQWTSNHFWALQSLVFIYKLLLIMITLAWIVEQDRKMRRALLVGGIASFIFFALFPAVGPAYFDRSHGVASALVPCNCMPSMHMVWALLIAVNARSRALKLILWSFAALTAVATIGLGQHYVVDLLAAIPYAAASQVVARLIPRWAEHWTPWGVAPGQSGRPPAIANRQPQGYSSSGTTSSRIQYDDVD
jgi:membrane-associated phospholipid phosphatase